MTDLSKGGEIAKSGLFFACFSSAALFAVKIVTYGLTGSMVVLGSAFDSLSDAVVSFVNAKISDEAREDPDSQHPFGHGGFEVVGALVQGIIILFLGYNLISESSRKIAHDSVEDLNFERLPYAAIVLAVSALFGFIIHKVLDKKNQHLEDENHRSLSVESDIAHYAGDMVVNLLSALGVLAAWYYNSTLIDFSLGIVSGLWLFKTAYPILKKSFSDIVHAQASPELQQEIVEAVLTCSDQILGIHQLRSRELGPILFVDFHLKLSRSLTLEKAHDVGDLAIAAIKDIIPRADVIVHLDPDSEEDQEEWEPQYTIPENLVD